MIDIDALERLAKTVTTGAAAQKSADPVTRNMGRLEFDDACKQYMRATNPAAIFALIAEVRALRADAARFRWLNSQRENVWHEFASIPMNRTCEVIDQEIAKEKA